MNREQGKIHILWHSYPSRRPLVTSRPPTIQTEYHYLQRSEISCNLSCCNSIKKIWFCLYIRTSKIQEIQNSISTPLVLHGGSGIPNQTRKKLAKETNIAKFNIGTEVRMAFGNALKNQMKKNPLVYDRLQLLKPTIPEITKITKKIIKNIGPK